jgi:MFS family permease
MIRKILAVVAGFVVWSVIWFAANAGVAAAGLLPQPGQAVTEPTVLALLLVASVLASLAAGYSASRLARAPGHKVALSLGVVLLAIGIFVQAQYWSLMPIWYHLAFLLLLVPVCLVGSRLRPNNSSKPTPLRGAA